MRPRLFDQRLVRRVAWPRWRSGYGGHGRFVALVAVARRQAVFERVHVWGKFGDATEYSGDIQTQHKSNGVCCAGRDACEERCIDDIGRLELLGKQRLPVVRGLKRRVVFGIGQVRKKRQERNEAGVNDRGKHHVARRRCWRAILGRAAQVVHSVARLKDPDARYRANDPVDR